MIPLQKVHLDENFDQKVMRRIKIVFYFKKLTRPIFLEWLFFLTLFILTALQVSIMDVFSNSLFMRSFEEFGNFWVKAFYNTELTVQLTVGLLIVFGLVLVLQSVKNTLKIMVKMRSGEAISN